MKLTVLGTLVLAGAVIAGLAAQGTEQTIMGCVKGDGTDANPWMLIGVVIPPPPPAAPAGGGGGGAAAAVAAAVAVTRAPPAGGAPAARGGGGCGRRAHRLAAAPAEGGGGAWRSWRWPRCASGSSPASPASAELQAQWREHDAVERPARRSDRHRNDCWLQRQQRALDVGNLPAGRILEELKRGRRGAGRRESPCALFSMARQIGSSFHAAAAHPRSRRRHRPHSRHRLSHNSVSAAAAAVSSCGPTFRTTAGSRSSA